MSGAVVSNAASASIDSRLPSIGKIDVRAAISKLFAASLGDVVVLLSKSPAHKHYALADIEWMVMPPVTLGQYHVVEVADQERGFRAPVALVTWAFVSQEVDERLRGTGGQRLRLRPDEWKSGNIAWLIDVVGEGRALDTALERLLAEPFKDGRLNLWSRDASGAVTLSTLEQLVHERRG